MQRSWLVQRLTAPYPKDKDGKRQLNPFSFGGGFKNGGLSDEAMDIVSEVFSFDYMGAAEFEFGALPKCLDRILQAHETLVCGSFKARYFYKGWGKEPSKEGDARLYFLCQKGDEKEVRKRARHWATAGCYGEMKESPMMDSSLAKKISRGIKGWLDLENDFFVFSDETMWRGTCELFGVKTPSKKKVSKQK